MMHHPQPALWGYNVMTQPQPTSFFVQNQALPPGISLLSTRSCHEEVVFFPLLDTYCFLLPDTTMYVYIFFNNGIIAKNKGINVGHRCLVTFLYHQWSKIAQNQFL